MILRCITVVIAGAILALPAADVRANGAAIRALPVPKETIYPGEMVTEERLTSRDFVTTPGSLVGVATSVTEIIGKETRRRLAAGNPVRLSGLTVPLAVKRGSTALAYYRDEGFSISTLVTALADGVEGDIIDARAAATGAIIKVQVLPDGELAVLGE